MAVFDKGNNIYINRCEIWMGIIYNMIIECELLFLSILLKDVGKYILCVQSHLTSLRAALILYEQQIELTFAFC